MHQWVVGQFLDRRVVQVGVVGQQLPLHLFLVRLFDLDLHRVEAPNQLEHLLLQQTRVQTQDADVGVPFSRVRELRLQPPHLLAHPVQRQVRVGHVAVNLFEGHPDVFPQPVLRPLVVGRAELGLPNPHLVHRHRHLLEVVDHPRLAHQVEFGGRRGLVARPRLLQRPVRADVVVELLSPPAPDYCGGPLSFEIAVRAIMQDLRTGLNYANSNLDEPILATVVPSPEARPRRHPPQGPLRPLSLFQPGKNAGADGLGPLRPAAHRRRPHHVRSPVSSSSKAPPTTSTPSSAPPSSS